MNEESKRLCVEKPALCRSSSSLYNKAINLLTLYRTKATIVQLGLMWPLMCGLLHLVPRGGDWAGPPRSTKCNTPLINGHCTNHRIAV